MRRNSVQAILCRNFWICMIFFVVICSKRNTNLCWILLYLIYEIMLICTINTIFLLSLSYTVWEDTAPGISASAVYWSRFDWGLWQNDHLLTLVCLKPTCIWFQCCCVHSQTRVYLVEITASGYSSKFLFQSCWNFFLHHTPKFRHTGLRWTLQQNFSTIRPLLWTCWW